LVITAVLLVAQEALGPEHRGQTLAGSRLMAAHFSPSPGGECLFSVAQIANLPCRRLQIGRALAVFRRPGQGAVLQDDILRYSRLAVCATNTTEALNRYRRRVKVGSRVSMSAEFEFFRVRLQLCEQLLPAAAPRVVPDGE